MLRGILAVVLVAISTSAQAGIATFDDLPSLAVTTTTQPFFFSNNDSLDYQGVTWDSRVTVVGDAYRVDTATPGPLFGLPHSGNYFITNDTPNNDGILLTTNQVLLSAWFGRNEYYGFGAGADQVTINALSGATVIGSVVFNLPAPAVAGQPGVMGFVDTSSFANLSGITGYRIDRHELGQQAGNWVADDFNFAAPRLSAPEPASLGLLALGTLCVGGAAARRRRVASFFSRSV